MCLYTKNTKDPPVFFSQNTTFQKSSSVLTKHYISYQKHLNPSNYKPCLYNLFVYLYTKNTKDRPVFFHKNTTFQKSSCVLTKHLNPSNYKPCLYNLFVYLYTKNIKVPPVFFSQNTTFQNPPVFFHKTLKSSVTIKPVYTTYLCIFTQKNTKDPPVFFFTKTLHFKKSSCVLTKHFFHKNTTFHIKTLKSE